ncbi:MAG: hypothetical protein QG663_771 [Thermodesulfobacteriota bacterium]|jgi:hypothetical protein|nr:hypothetical protein [Thermodesulfobacteriota bacterium]
MFGNVNGFQQNCSYITRKISGLPKLNYPRLTGMYLSIARIKGDATKIEE